MPEVTQLISSGLGFEPRESAPRGCALRKLTVEVLTPGQITTREQFQSMTFLGAISQHSNIRLPERPNGNTSPRCFLFPGLHPSLRGLACSAPDSAVACSLQGQWVRVPRSLRGRAGDGRRGLGLHLQVRMSRIWSSGWTEKDCARVHVTCWDPPAAGR